MHVRKDVGMDGAVNERGGRVYEVCCKDQDPVTMVLETPAMPDIVFNLWESNLSSIWFCTSPASHLFSAVLLATGLC